MQDIEYKVNKDAKIAVLCGGMSSEAEVSMRSGKGCFEALKRLGYHNAEMVVVDKNIAQKLADGNMIMHSTLCTASMVKTDVFREFWKFCKFLMRDAVLCLVQFV